MNVQEIRNQLNAIAARLAAKGYVNAHAELVLRDDEAWKTTRLDFEYRTSEGASTTYVYVRDMDVEFSTDTADFFREAVARVEALPTVREARIKEFVNSLEELKTKAEDLEIDADFVNPLAALMQKLATNALTYRK